MAKKEENTPKAPRLSTIERLQLQLADAKAKQKERDAKKVDAIKEQYRAAVVRQQKAELKVADLVRRITEAVGHDEMVRITEAIDEMVRITEAIDEMIPVTEAIDEEVNAEIDAKIAAADGEATE